MNTSDFLLAAGLPSATAIVDQGGSHSYEELRVAVMSITASLRTLDLPAGAPVVILAPNGLFWAAAHLAVLTGGLVSVPLPVNVPEGELRARSSFVGARAAVLGGGQRSLAERLDLPAVIEGEAVAAWTVEGPDFASIDPATDAVFMFTSGTTGQPKVVRLTHANLQSNTESILSFLPIKADDRTLVVLPFTYVFGASLLYTHLRTGACLVIQPNFVFPESIVDRLVTERCTGFAGVPSTFHVLLRNSTFGRRALPDLRIIQQAGGKLSPTLSRELVDAQPQARVFVMYGQTEATARLSFVEPEHLLQKLGSIGRGIPGVQLRVLDDSGRPVSPGQTGEIHAIGANISPGYLNDPAATAAKFPGGALRTGDLAVVDEDGFIYIVDRVEDFIKSWGFRVASQDVEAVIMKIPDVVAAAVVGIPDAAAGERIEVGVVVRSSGSNLDRADILRHCREQLAKHMVPTDVHFLDSLPLNDNGKVSKSRLRAMLAEKTSSE